MKARALSTLFPAGWNPLAFRGICGLGLLLQSVLIWSKINGPCENRLAGLLVFLPLAVPLLLWNGRFPGWFQMGVATGTAGGLAMLIVFDLDQAGQGRAAGCCQIPNPDAPSGMRSVLNWSNGLMALACILCHVSISPRSQCKRGTASVWLKSLGCLCGMWLGMILGGNLLTHAFEAAFGHVAGAHFAMVIGMMMGATISHLALEFIPASFPAKVR